MSKILIVTLIALMGIGLLSAQQTSYYNDSFSWEETADDVAATDVGVPNPPNKYVVLAISLGFIVVFYFLLLGNYPKLLQKGINPLTAAATQCMYFSLIWATVVLLAVFAMSDFNISYIGATFLSNLGLIVFIAVVWLIYFIITISNKNKGITK